MSEPTPSGLRTSPDPRVDSTTRVPTADEFRSMDRLAGWIVVNRWTYRILRLVGGLARLPVDTSGVSVEEQPDVGRGVRIVRPMTRLGEGAVLLFHGGGFVAGTNREADGKAAVLARRAGVPVVCPAYRLAPDDPFPAALDDGHAAWTWLQEAAAGLGTDPTKVVVGGISAGGGLAAALVQRLHDDGGTQPAGQVLVYPMLDDRTAARRELDTPRHRVWSNGNNRFGWSSYLGQEPGGTVPPYAVPARRADLRGLPPAWIGVGTSDLFLDEDREYARRLEDAGVPVTYIEVDGAIHGFDGTPDSALADAFDASMGQFVSDTTR